MVSSHWISKGISILILSSALAVGFWIKDRNFHYPTSDDASIDAEVVHVAAAVGGRLMALSVRENDKVKRGDLLFRLDPEPYRLMVEQAEADLELAKAVLEERHRLIVSEKLNAQIAAQQKKRAETHLQLAKRTTNRLRPLNERDYVPTQEFDQAETAQRDAATSLIEAEKQAAAADQIVGNPKEAEAMVRARQAALAIAKRALSDTEVFAPTDGRIVGLTVTLGEMVVPAQSLFTLVAVNEWSAVANFRETDLRAIEVGDCVTAYSMVDRSIPIKGVVTGLGWGVLDTDRINLPRSVPYVERSLNWVRVAQRFPVRIALENPPENLMRLGASSVVEIKHGSACS